VPRAPPRLATTGASSGKKTDHAKTIASEAGLSQQKLAKLLGVAGITIQKIEQGRLALSPELAQKAQDELGVSAAWLLNNDPKITPVNFRGGSWAKPWYEYTQTLRLVSNFALDQTADTFTAWQVAEINARIDSLLTASKGTPKQGILLHRLRESLNELAEQFPTDEAVLAEHAPGIAKLRAAFKHVSGEITQEETRRLWGDKKAGGPSAEKEKS
jgi:transcriptional regulator with XRE-family HTH domain